MTRAGQKVPFPMPTNGIIADQHPFAIGHGNLSLSQNWWNHDGIFKTRNGLLSIEPSKRWYERLANCPNLVPELLAECDPAGILLLDYEVGDVVVVAEVSDAITGDHQFTATVGVGIGTADITANLMAADPGLPYTAWIFGGPNATANTYTLEFLDDEAAVLSSHALSGDAIDQGLWLVTATAPPGTVGVQYRTTAIEGSPVHFGPFKVCQGEEIIAWSAGDGYVGGFDENLFAMEVAHPETTEEAIAIWDGIEGRESPISYQGGEMIGLFDDYDQMPFVGRAIAYSAQPSQIIPSFEEVTGLLLKEEYRVPVSPVVIYKMSASFFFDVENDPLFEMLYDVEGVYYDISGAEIGTVSLVSTDISGVDGAYYITNQRGRGEATFVPPPLTETMGIRIKCMCPTAKRTIVYDNNGKVVYDNDGLIVTIDEENYEARRVGIILDDVKLVEGGPSGPRWWDFELPEITHSGPVGRGEFPLNYYPHDYLFEGETEANRIVMASDKSLWQWDDVADEWIWIGFDLETIYSAWYLTGTDEDDEETVTLDERIVFEETDPEGYTSEPGEPDELVFEITLRTAQEGSTTPYPAQSWKYRINDGDWSTEYNLRVDPPIKEVQAEFEGRELDFKIKLILEDYDEEEERWTDFDDVCVIPDPVPDDWEDPIFSGRVVTRRHEDEVDETVFHTDRDGPVDLRGYDFGQKTWVVCANPNDRVTVWDGQPGSQIERAGAGSPFARTICVSGGRVLAGNIRFDDPGLDFVAPLAVVFSDTFLGRGFRKWHPEVAIRLADTPGEIVKLLEMGTLAVAAYKTDAVYMLVFQTGNNPFRTQLMASNIAGPIGVRAVAAMTENTHLYLGEDGGIYIFDGSKPRNFSPNISRTIQYELDLNFKDRAFLSYTPRLNAVLAMYPTKGSDGRVNRGMWIDIEKGAGWPFEWNGPLFDFSAGAPVQTITNYQMGGVTVRMGSVTSALAEGQSLQPDFFMGAADGSTYVMDETAEDDWGHSIRALMRSGLTEFGLLDRYSVLKEMEFIINRTTRPHMMDVEIWAADHGFDARPVSHETIDIFQDGPYFAEVREKARFWGYGLAIEASEQIAVSGAYGSLRPLGRRKS